MVYFTHDGHSSSWMNNGQSQENWESSTVGSFYRKTHSVLHHQHVQPCRSRAGVSLENGLRSWSFGKATLLSMLPPYHFQSSWTNYTNRKFEQTMARLFSSKSRHQWYCNGCLAWDKGISMVKPWWDFICTPNINIKGGEADVGVVLLQQLLLQTVRSSIHRTYDRTILTFQQQVI